MIASFLLLAWFISDSLKVPTNRITYPELLSKIESNTVERVSIRGNHLIGLNRNSPIARVDYPARFDFETTIGPDFIDTVRTMFATKNDKPVDQISVNDLGFKVDYLPPIVTPWYVEMLPYILTMGLVMVFWFLIMRQQTGGSGRVMNFGKSSANMVDPTKNKITFADVAGADEEKDELKEIVDFLKNPKNYLDLGARIPKGVLLVGPPGTGKTLLAKAVAGEAKVPFFSISGSNFVEMFVGVGASRVRDLFEQAKRMAPSIVFIDEIDAVGRHRGAGLGGGHDEREQTLNQLLVEMDGFTTNEGVIVMAATNRQDILDPALLRPGRFDRQITVSYPDINGRVAILKVHARGKPLADDVDLENIAKRTPFATGADLENIMNEGAIIAARFKDKQIHQSHLIEAVERVQMGPEKKSRKVLEEDKRIVAYHEAGHAVVGHYLPLCDEVHTVTIVPRGDAGGFTLSLPEKEFYMQSKEKMLQTISMMLGGHAAVKLIENDIYTGAQSDLKRATEVIRTMVTKLGMSENIGTLYLGNDQEIFVGMEFGQSREFSEETATKVDHEVSSMMRKSYDVAMSLLKTHIDKLHGLAKLLMEKETINREEFLQFMNDTPVDNLMPSPSHA
ncbi:MAG: ATP-dependent metallopeptidase FtsH/Yme1/Tma family protein [Clostridiales bacterium]|jgi:cell division protease FtsH|nr:ATP-dependent metallopeptidase FtsH/Yme1/Tma family protein [Clostridiales bacterium]HHT08071.1 ATP-dependent metallopeptidase FtsH/Yme1/Tma family protein [Clostridiales bacterium]